jgi:NYN domain/OST-HTH/LOTUS domain
MQEKSVRLAVLIDAENAQATIADALFAEIAKLGVASVKRIYGDFTHPGLGGWRGKLAEHSIEPVQQFSNTKGKNASDIALIIDAMDLLHSRRFEGFCIVSSDSDFTRLASRIRAEGVTVYGFGEKKAPQAFVNACDKFTYTEVLRPAPARAERANPATPRSAAGKERVPVEVLKNAIEDSSDESGWAHLSQVGTTINNRLSDFDPRNFGYSKLITLIESVGSFEIRRQGKAGGPQSILVRVKPR